MLCFKQHECHAQSTRFGPKYRKPCAFRKTFKEHTKKQGRALEKGLGMLVQILCSGSLSFENLMNALRTETWEGTSRISENIPPVSNKHKITMLMNF